MSEKANILFIVEGERLEPEIIGRMAEVYGLQCKISSVRTNIHILYSLLKKDDGYSDVIPVLKEMLRKRLESLGRGKTCAETSAKIKRTREDLEKLELSYSSVFLVFDGEFQHTEVKGLQTDDRIARNYCELKEMFRFFDNETEQGKLYVNYPMMESFRDCDDFFDNEFRDRFVSLDLLTKYKEIVSKRQLARVHINSITQQQFNKLVCMNVYKLNWPKSGKWRRMRYERFLETSKQASILELEYSFSKKLHAIAVLNTLLFFIIDYKGKDFYTKNIHENNILS